MTPVELVAWTALTTLTCVSWVLTALALGWKARAEELNERAFEDRRREEHRAIEYAQSAEKWRLKYDEFVKGSQVP